MIKVIHTSDFHIGVPVAGMRGRDIRNLRRNDIFSAIDRVFKFAVNENVNIVIISGDIFHSPNPSPQDFLKLDELLKYLEENGVHVVAIAGNHDKRKIRGEEGYLSIYKSRGGEYIHYQDKISDKPLVISVGDAKIGFVLIPYLSGKFVKAHTGDRYVKEYQSVIEKIVTRQLSKLNGVDYKILVGHLTVSGANLGPKISYVAYDDPPIHINTLHPEQFDYIALGHIHVPQKISQNIYYSGSIERIDFSEENIDKLFYLITLRDKLEVKKIPLASRKMITLDISVSPLSSPLNQIINVISSEDVKGAMLRIKLSGETDVINRLYLEIHRLDNMLFNKLGVAAYKIETRYLTKVVKEKVDYKEIDLAKAFEDYIKNRFRGRRKEVLDKAIEVGRRFLNI